ncbi:MAG: protein phosphatase 2C domain-containing protein [Anaerolineales bacterium]
MRPADKPHLIVGALSHPGEKRDHNEDRYSVTAYRVERSGQPTLLAVVADGVGGHQAGEVAAEMTVEAVVERIGRSSGRDPLPTLRAAVAEAARAVIESADKDEALAGMGSTLAAVWVIGSRLYLTYVGDSRIYFLRDDHIHQLSNDHTWVQEALEHEIISLDEAVDHPHAHVLRRHIGGDKPPEPDLRVRFGTADPAGSSSQQGLQLEVGDRLLLCSDGLTDLVENQEIASILAEHSPSSAARELVDLARRRGGHDNITVIVLQVPAGQIRGRRINWLGWGLIGTLLAALLAAAIGLTLAWRFDLWPFHNAVGQLQSTPSASQPAILSSTQAVVTTATPPPASATVTPTPGPTATAVPLATVAPQEP